MIGQHVAPKKSGGGASSSSKLTDIDSFRVPWIFESLVKLLEVQGFPHYDPGRSDLIRSCRFVFLAFPAIRIQLIISSILPAGIRIGYELTAAWKGCSGG
ncbi:uncharacterized protein APUU_11649A [Aspergillus puulaauensis]|uniref:Uncharacterized protein n=1 Tax=Aspergillus puulaauensis TaxID=1220207 RepID=A0A7R8AH97_9EURO|nr:uncharacterized protein APUU_11649A [Aspergillus puulaauensis]BCS18821.1 hypothetical protein APUU_11649A [Aspergillus puulaauensis]